MALTSLCKHTKLELCTIVLARANLTWDNRRKYQLTCPKMHPFCSVPRSIQVHYLSKVMIKCHLVKPYYSCIIGGFKIQILHTFSHMVTVTGTSFKVHCITVPSAGDTYKTT